MKTSTVGRGGEEEETREDEAVASLSRVLLFLVFFPSSLPDLLVFLSSLLFLRSSSLREERQRERETE